MGRFVVEKTPISPKAVLTIINPYDFNNIGSIMEIRPPGGQFGRE